MKTFAEFQEGVAALALKGGSKLIPALMTGIGAAGTIMQAKRSQDTKESRGRRSEKPKRKLSRMQQKMIDLENKRGENVTKITKPKKGEKKEAKKTVKDFLKARKKEGETMYKLKQDAEIADKGPGDLLPAAKKSYLEKLRRNLRKPENQFHTEDAIPTNNASSGNIAGLPPDSPPVKKKKKKTYAYGGRGSRKMWMNNK